MSINTMQVFILRFNCHSNCKFVICFADLGLSFVLSRLSIYFADCSIDSIKLSFSSFNCHTLRHIVTFLWRLFILKWKRCIEWKVPLVYRKSQRINVNHIIRNILLIDKMLFVETTKARIKLRYIILQFHNRINLPKSFEMSTIYRYLRYIEGIDKKNRLQSVWKFEFVYWFS